jgi:predicted RNA-binding Zn ribbon-like protein
VDVAELERQVEYKFAPGPLIAVQALANTFAFEPGEERLADPQSAREWLLASDLATEEVRVDEVEWRKLLALRSAVRDLIEANLDGDPRAAAAEVRALAREHPVVLAVGEGGELGTDLAPVASVEAFVSQVLGIVLQAQIAGTWERLKVCASDECRWAFYDASRNRGGTWCNMKTCGNVIKNRAYRERLRRR